MTITKLAAVMSVLMVGIGTAFLIAGDNWAGGLGLLSSVFFAIEAQRD